MLEECLPCEKPSLTHDSPLLHLLHQMSPNPHHTVAVCQGGAPALPLTLSAHHVRVGWRLRPLKVSSDDAWKAAPVASPVQVEVERMSKPFCVSIPELEPHTYQ